jgi:hypothetical protein
MRIGLAFLWIMLVVAPLIAEKNPPPAVADNARPLAEQHAASTYSDKPGIHQGATGGKFR